MRYRYNPYCPLRPMPCSRIHGTCGPDHPGCAVSAGAGEYIYWMDFDRTWPALLIVIGLVLFLRHSAPATGHVPREYVAVPPANAGYARLPVGSRTAVATPPVVTPAPVPPAGTRNCLLLSAGETNDTEVHNG